MKKIILCLTILCTLVGCTIEYRKTPSDNIANTPVVTYPQENSYIEIGYYDHCVEDPYWYAEQWCDFYDDGTMCCVWYVDGWYEEWCQWEYDWCWEYNGSF